MHYVKIKEFQIIYFKFAYEKKIFKLARKNDCQSIAVELSIVRSIEN